jgi:peptide/nickel transport system permease protein
MPDNQTGVLMTTQIIRRLLLNIPTLFFVTLIIFVAIRLLPADAITIMVASRPGVSKEDVPILMQEIERELGLNEPIHIQYFRYLKGLVLHGDLGTSIWSGRPVLEHLAPRIPVTLELAALSMAIAMMIAVPIGIFSSIRQDTVGDYVARSFALLLICLPGFWIATMVLVFPALWWKWSPGINYVPFTENPSENLKMMLIPAAVIGMHVSGMVMRMTRTMMLEVLRQDFIRTAWAKGLKELIVLRRHALKNALIPVVSLVGISVPSLIGGQVIVEQIFVIPGMGRLLMEAVLNRDYPIISGINLVIAAVILATNLLIDLTYRFLDPRIR